MLVFEPAETAGHGDPAQASHKRVQLLETQRLNILQTQVHRAPEFTRQRHPYHSPQPGDRRRYPVSNLAEMSNTGEIDHHIADSRWQRNAARRSLTRPRDRDQHPLGHVRGRCGSGLSG